MPRKNLLEDIKPLSRETRGGIQHVPVSPRRAAAAPRLPRELPFEPVEPKSSPRYGLWYLAIACVVAFLFSLSFLFERATVSIVPKSVPVAFDTTDTFTAQKDSTASDTIVFTKMTLSGDQAIKLPSTSSKNQSLPATGQVILYNTYSSSPYKLVKSTRLQSPSGKIYRIDSAVTIPGYKKTLTGITPGSVAVSVTAAEAGEASNIDQSDFTVPGLAGSAQATKIYGRTKTAIAGGISGTLYSVPQDAANAALGTLQDKLKSSLLAKAKVQVPDGYLFYDGASVFSADDSIQVPYSKDPQVPIALHGTLTAYLIKENTLVAAVAKKAISQYSGEAVTIPKIASLTLAPTGALEPTVDTVFAFTLSGTAPIVWTVNPETIRTELAGTKKSDFNDLLSKVIGVERAEVIIKPFWKRSFPKDPLRITVNVQTL